MAVDILLFVAFVHYFSHSQRLFQLRLRGMCFLLNLICRLLLLIIGGRELVQNIVHLLVLLAVDLVLLLLLKI